jgi:biotin carboxyl carrier protein
VAKKEIRSEVAGVVLSVAGLGQRITVEDEIAVVEAMKMEIPLVSSVAGSVVLVHVAEGATIGEGDLIVTVETVAA